MVRLLSWRPRALPADARPCADFTPHLAGAPRQANRRRRARVELEVLVDLGRLDTLAPATGDEDHVQAELPGHLRPQASEMPGVEGQHAVARRQRVDERGFPGPVPDEG